MFIRRQCWFRILWGRQLLQVWWVIMSASFIYLSFSNFILFMSKGYRGKNKDLHAGNSDKHSPTYKIFPARDLYNLGITPVKDTETISRVGNFSKHVASVSNKVLNKNKILFEGNGSDFLIAPRVRNILQGMVILPPDNHLKENMSYFKPGPQVLNDFSSGFFLISAPHVCGGRDSPSLVVVVPSVVYHSEIRAAIRATWGSPARGKLWPYHTHRLSVKLVFIFGVTNDKNDSRDLHEESQRYGDIVQGNFHDSYRNLSIKIAAALHWINVHCPGAKHVLKVDEDTFVNIPLLMEILDYMTSLKLKFVLGHKHFYVRPRVTRTGRWAVDRTLYPFPEFPAYLYGHSYVVSRGAVSDLLFAFKRRLLMPNEDALFTGVLASTMGVTRIHSHSFAHPLDQQRNATWCEEARGLRVSLTHFRSASAILNMWFDIILRHCHGDV